MNKILIIEDNVEIAEMERDFLEASDFAVTIETDGEAGLAELAQGGYSLVLLDIMLPGRDGFAICRDIRAKSEVPVLIVSARGEDIDKIRGLGLGADDYITKPFSPGELIARVKSHITRYERVLRQGAETGAAEAAAPSQELVRGELRIERLSHRVFLGKKELTLPNKEYELLKSSSSSTSGASTPSATRRPSWFTSTASAAASSPIPRTRSTSRPSGARGIVSAKADRFFPQDF